MGIQGLYEQVPFLQGCNLTAMRRYNSKKNTTRQIYSCFYIRLLILIPEPGNQQSPTPRYVPHKLLQESVDFEPQALNRAQTKSLRARTAGHSHGHGAGVLADVTDQGLGFEDSKPSVLLLLKFLRCTKPIALHVPYSL